MSRYRYSLFARLILFGCAVCIIPVVALGFFSYMRSSEAIQNHVNESNVQIMRQKNATIEQILKTMDSGLNQVINSTLFEEAIYNRLTFYEFQTYNFLKKELSYLQSFDTKVTDVVLVNKENDWLVNSYGLYRFEEFPGKDQLIAYFQLPNQTNWTMQENAPGSPETDKYGCKHIISLVKKVPFVSFEPRGLAIAHIPVCSLASMMGNDAESSQAMIVAPDNTIWVHANPEMIGKRLNEIGFIDDAELDRFTGKSGQFETSSGDFTATYVRSELNGWLYVSFTEVSQITQQARAIGWYTMYACILIIAVSGFFIWFGSRTMYRPIRRIIKAISEESPGLLPKKKDEIQLINEHIQRLFHHNSSLKHELNQNSQQVRTFFLNRLYEGLVKSGELEQRMELYGYADKISSWEHMCVLTLQVDLLDQTKYSTGDLDLLLFAINNIIEETIPAQHRIHPVILNQTQVTLVGNRLSPELFNDWIYQLTETVQQNIKLFLGLDVSIGISLPFNNISKASRAYQEGQEALKHRLNLGKAVIVRYADINYGKHTLMNPFPQQVVNELADAIKLADQDKALELLQQWMNKVFHKERSPHDYQIALVRLLNDLMVVLQESGISIKKVYDGEGSLYDELLQLYVSAEIEQWFKTKLIMPMIQVFRDRLDSQYHNLSEQMIAMIHNEYDKDLTLEECAARLHYNAFYLSGVFKKETNQSFSDYLSAYRMNMARKWLVETDMPIKDIAHKLRYNNSQNFIRSFRKLTDMTPGQYRTKYGKLAE